MRLLALLLLLIISLSFSSTLTGQSISGQVLNENSEPLEAATIIGMDQDSAFIAFTTSDKKGVFKLNGEGIQLIQISYIGYESDTLAYDALKGAEIDIILSHANNLDIVEIVHRQKTTEVSLLDPIKVHKIGEEELMKAACCNLSESFTRTCFYS